MPLRVSLVITTYNWPEALAAVFDTIATQSHTPHEVVIADDGSKEATREMIERYRRNFPCPIVHAWHEDNGYQVAKIRNKSRVNGDWRLYYFYRRRLFVAEGIRRCPRQIVAAKQLRFR